MVMILESCIHKVSTPEEKKPSAPVPTPSPPSPHSAPVEKAAPPAGSFLYVVKIHVCPILLSWPTYFTFFLMYP